MTSELPLVVVEWKDAWVREEPILLSDAKSSHTPTIVTTIGWVLVDDDEGLSIANEHYDSSYRGRTFIPRAMVMKVTAFKLTTPRKRKAANGATDNGTLS